MNRGVVFCPAHNSPGKRDATGAFIPEGQRFADEFGLDVYRFDNRNKPWKRRREVERALAQYPNAEVVGFFCHGFKTGLQTGHRLWAMDGLVELLSQCTPGVKVYLAACSTARDKDAADRDDRTDAVGGEGGFADKLRDEIVAKRGESNPGGWIDAHATLGHATRNPYVRRFELVSPNEGATWIVEPQSDRWVRWKRALRTTDLRIRYPLLSLSSIYLELDGADGPIQVRDRASDSEGSG